MQTSIFYEIAKDAGYKIPEAINDGKDKFEMMQIDEVLNEGMFIFRACNKSGMQIFNILNEEGKTPLGLSVCWRSHNHIITDLNQIKNHKL